MAALGQKPTDHEGAAPAHYLGAAGEHLVAAYFLSTGQSVFFPVAQAGWTDLVVGGPHGFKRIQVKTSGVEAPNGSIRVRRVGGTDGLDPSDRYDLLAVVHTHRLWLIPAATLDGKDGITLHPQKPNCQFAGFRKR